MWCCFGVNVVTTDLGKARREEKENTVPLKIVEPFRRGIFDIQPLTSLVPASFVVRTAK